MLIQVESLVLAKASLDEASFNRYTYSTYTSMLIKLRAVAVAIQIIIIFDGLAVYIPVENVHCKSLVVTEIRCFLAIMNSYFEDRLKKFSFFRNSESHVELPRGRVLHQ